MRRVHTVGLEFARSDTVFLFVENEIGDAVERIRSVSDFGCFGLKRCDNKVVRVVANLILRVSVAKQASRRWKQCTHRKQAATVACGVSAV